MAGSSVDSEQRNPAATISGSGCSSYDGTAPTRTLAVGQTSSTVPRSTSSRISAGSSTARIPCRIRSACRASSAPQMDDGPTTSPAWGTEPNPPSRASRKASAKLLGRRLALDTAEADPDHAAIAGGDRSLDDGGRFLGR